jgi:hypothetical protein
MNRRGCCGVATVVGVLGAIALAAEVGAVVVRAHRPRTLALEPGVIWSLAFVDDGKALVVDYALPQGHACTTYSAATGAELARPGVVLALSGASLAAFAGGNHVYLLNALSGTVTARYELAASVTAVALSRNGELFAAASERVVEVRSTRDGALVKSLEIPDVVHASSDRLAFSPRGDRVALQSIPTSPGAYFPEGRVVSWSLADGQATAPVSGRLLGFAPDGELLIRRRIADSLESMSANGAIRSRFIPDIDLNIALSGAGDRVAAYGMSEDHDIVIDVREVESGALLRRFVPRDRAGGHALALSPEGDELAIGYENGTVDIWSLHR